MIYFLRRADGAIKIGTTEKYYTRRSALTAEFGELELLGVMEGGREEEQKLHKRFAHVRIDTTRKVEWFQPAQELLDYIAEHTSQEVRTTRETTIRLSTRTYLILKSFQQRHFVRTGERLTNDAAIALAIQLASAEATQWVERFLTRGDREPANIVTPDKR